MSFASDLERGYAPSGSGRTFGGGGNNGGGYQSGGFGMGGSGSDDEYNYEKNQVSSNIRTMAAFFQQIIDASSNLGTDRDSAEFRENMYESHTTSIGKLWSESGFGCRKENEVLVLWKKILFAWSLLCIPSSLFAVISNDHTTRIVFQNSYPSFPSSVIWESKLKFRLPVDPRTGCCPFPSRFVELPLSLFPFASLKEFRFPILFERLDPVK